jgi:ABC-type cobalamin/Fe3+-siderophores transport system ATPase subunit
MEALCDRNERDELTILFITHDVSLATRHATHAALVHGGSVETGMARNILSEERLEAAYGIALAPEGGGA